jgi:hypothetical protein
MSVQDKTGEYQSRRFTQSYEALGIVAEFVTRERPFDEYRAGKLMTALKHQIAHGHHVCVFRGETLVGYCGWLPITEDLGKLWVAGKAELVPVPPEQANAVALSVFRVEDTKAMRHLTRASRKLIGAGKRVYYLGRVFSPGGRLPRRRESVLIVPSG